VRQQHLTPLPAADRRTTPSPFPLQIRLNHHPEMDAWASLTQSPALNQLDFRDSSANHCKFESLRLYHFELPFGLPIFIFEPILGVALS
jgi:hypothetical protein